MMLSGQYLEFGTTHVAARPWLRSGFLERRAITRALLEKPVL